MLLAGPVLHHIFVYFYTSLFLKTNDMIIVGGGGVQESMSLELDVVKRHFRECLPAITFKVFSSQKVTFSVKEEDLAKVERNHMMIVW